MVSRKLCYLSCELLLLLLAAFLPRTPRCCGWSWSSCPRPASSGRTPTRSASSKTPSQQYWTSEFYSNNEVNWAPASKAVPANKFLHLTCLSVNSDTLRMYNCTKTVTATICYKQTMYSIIHKLVAHGGWCFVYFVLDPISVHGPKTRTTWNIYHKRMNYGVKGQILRGLRPKVL